MSLTKSEPARDYYCKHCGMEIYHWSNGWIPNAKGSWYHYHNDKEHCSHPHQSYAEPKELNHEPQ